MERQRAFQLLKQPCIHLLQVTARLSQNPSARKELIQALSDLLSTLRATTKNPGVLDAKLTEYAFVPISQVLRISRQAPVRALEICLECISVLLCAGWGGGLEPALSGQLLILFTFLAKPSSGNSGISATSEELQALALKCISELMTDLSRSKQSQQSITATSNIPALGEAVLVMLESLTDSNSNNVKFQAVSALRSTTNAIGDDDALASFLPRIVSSLTKVLTPSSGNRPGFRVVEQGLDVLSLVLGRLLSDLKVKNLPEKAQSEGSGDDIKVLRSTSWLQATSSQVKIALANVFKLRDHDKPEVRQALLKLCLRIIQDCRTSLVLCTSMATETLISLAGHEGSGDSVENELKGLLLADQTLSDLLRESLHGWIIALPRMMQSKDDQGRRRIIHQISVSLRLFEQDPTILDERLADSLRDGVSAVFSDARRLEEVNDSASNAITDRTLTLSSTKSLSFSPISLQFKGQDDMMAEFRLLVQELARSTSALTVAQGLADSVGFGTTEMRLASFWLSLNLVRDVTTSNPSIEDFMDLGAPNPREELLDDLYSHSLSLLNQRDSTTDTSWHFYALALETVALQAKRYRIDFRPELSEVLYPVLHYLGSSNAALREHALTCLNIVAEASGYADAGELVVGNVDYIVNAVGLKLAYGDVSPQAPQVLLMMMRLCGPSLLPYLDDLVDSIFDALERYHGYPKLAELLFSVLKGMTEEGVKEPQLAITAGDTKAHGGTRETRPTMNDVVEALKKLEADSRRRDEEEKEATKEPFPQQPWKEEKKLETADGEPNEDEEEAPPPKTEEPPPPAPRTFTILLKISELTQHYLTTNSPTLRNSLLSLLQTTIPALAKHENSFLPLINTLWPVLLPRLQDPEAYIVSNALEIVALMCMHAGEFMRTRIEDAWDVFRRVYKRTQQQDIRKKASDNKFSPLKIGSIETGMTNLSMDARPTTNLSRPELLAEVVQEE
ncbi:heat repeat-containing protein [Stemphylium lycopersici]|uniref:Heat repeat-containing protein n=1 Tax=Stemphylium lycopersici TaxID=183478 RepID=A0A364N6X1_STELY|nr:heat repeat-containing protein [Stemphylium lycopersici]RAR03063.1 heat repeat-containing protein [Stemphylium lycopersici]RAR13075.1 heat repeat-containing protein [Stemphylium lycopersici]